MFLSLPCCKRTRYHRTDYQALLRKESFYTDNNDKNAVSMSFYHILPSNVAESSFPNNNASAYSTPLSNPYVLKGKWEVTLMNMTYSGCVNTFHNDKITVYKRYTTNEHLIKTKKPLKLVLEKGKKLRLIIQELQVLLKGVVSLNISEDKEHCTWRILHSHLCLVFDIPLQELFNLWNDVITPWDNAPSNYEGFNMNDVSEQEMTLLIVPITSNVTTIPIKVKKEIVNPQKIMNRFNERVKLATMSMNDGKSHFIVQKHATDNHVILFSEKFVNALTLRQGGIYTQQQIRFATYNFSNIFQEEWNVYIFKVDEVALPSRIVTNTIDLKPHAFHNHSDAVTYLNKLVEKENLVFSCDEANHLHLKITDENTSVTFDDTLRDIFAFDVNAFAGRGDYAASDVFSLTRRIHYLYVYSNVGDYVRIGNTEAPLLSIIPFATGDCDLLKEKVFKYPMYVRVIHDHISQIDIEIRDDAGQHVPFITDAITSIRLHFRQV